MPSIKEIPPGDTHFLQLHVAYTGKTIATRAKSIYLALKSSAHFRCPLLTEFEFSTSPLRGFIYLKELSLRFKFKVHRIQAAIYANTCPFWALYQRSYGKYQRITRLWLSGSLTPLGAGSFTACMCA